MKYKCSICGQVVETDLHDFVEHTEGHIVEVIRQEHPEWSEKNGMCRKCLEHYRKQLKGEG